MKERPKISPGLAAEIEASLQRLCAQGEVEISEDSAPLPEFAAFQFQVRDEPRGAFVHVWNEERNLVRRALAVRENSASRLALEVSRFGRSKPSRLEFALRDAARAPQRLSREKFRARFQRLWDRHFPDEELVLLTTAPDLEHSFSGSYARGVARSGSAEWAVLAASAAENAGTLDAMLTFGLLWLDWCRNHATRRAVAGLRLFFPEESGEAATQLSAHRLAALAPETRVELFTFHERAGRVTPLEARDRGNLQTWLAPHREFERLRTEARDVTERIVALAPEAIDHIARISPAGAAADVLFRFRGLEFARWHAGQLTFPSALDDEGYRAWRSGAWSELKALVRMLADFRRADARDRNHPLFRAAPERWLERLVAEDLTRIDPALRLDPIYSQVPSLGPGRGILDLLAVTRDGRLAVIELKASEDLHLLLQGADYWLRVRWHLQQGDFARHGYFRNLELQSKPPLLFLVAPGFRFHPATEILLTYLSPEIEVTRIGLKENWRQGLQIVFRQ